MLLEYVFLSYLNAPETKKVHWGEQFRRDHSVSWGISVFSDIERLE